VATVDPAGLVGRLLDRAADVATFDLDIAPGAVGRLIALHGLAQPVGQDEGHLVLDAQIAAELQGAHARHGVDEDHDRQAVVAHRQLAAVKERAAGDAEVLVANLAFDDRATGIGVDGEATAVRASRLAVRLGPAQRLERGASCLVRHAGDLHERHLRRLDRANRLGRLLEGVPFRNGETPRTTCSGILHAAAVRGSWRGRSHAH
jgi:hypothetical protein